MYSFDIERPTTVADAVTALGAMRRKRWAVVKR